MSQALRPTNLFNEFSGVIEEPKDKPQHDDEELSLAHLGVSDGWNILEAKIVDMMNELDNAVREAMNQGASYEDIGRRTAVKEITKDALRRIIDTVHDARDAVERSRQ